MTGTGLSGRAAGIQRTQPVPLPLAAVGAGDHTITPLPVVCHRRRI